MKHTVYLPFPSKNLSPNARPHWAKLAAAKKAYKMACGWALTAAGVRRIDADTLAIRITFFPPDARARDRDNMIAAFKAGQDAIAEITGIDDAMLDVSYAPVGPAVRPNGQIKVEIEWTERERKAA